MITIEPFELISRTDKGETYQMQSERTGTFVFGTRRAGSINGRHYHKGNAPTKNPELFYLFTGKGVIRVLDLHTQERAEIFVEGPCRISFPPYMFHELEALTDISFMECNSRTEHAGDTYYLQ
jgi:dTDP-4-dehydrorhamnose 3,5-epimerase-like enzyme